jgi:hypothetical protein
MNLDDLRRELRTRAAEPGPASMPERLAGVRSKVRAARRRKAAATGAAVLASVSVLGLVWGPLWQGGGDDVAEGEFVPLPTQIHGDRLIDAEYNDSDSGQLSWSVTLDDLGVIARVTCHLPDNVVLPHGDAPVMLRWGVDGSLTYGSECGSAGVSNLQPDGPTSRSDWRALGVQRDESFDLDVRLEQGADRIDVAGARFGIGLYEVGDRERSHGVALPLVVDLDEDSYRLGDHKTLPLTDDRRRLRLEIPESSAPIAVVYGWQSDIQAASCELLRDGEPFRSCFGGPLEGPEVVDSDEPQTLTLWANGSSADGVLVLAYYELDD